MLNDLALFLYFRINIRQHSGVFIILTNYIYNRRPIIRKTFELENVGLYKFSQFCFFMLINLNVYSQYRRLLLATVDILFYPETLDGCFFMIVPNAEFRIDVFQILLRSDEFY